MITFYQEASKFTDKYGKILIFVIAKLAPHSWILPKLLLSLFIYFTMDLREDSFELPMMMRAGLGGGAGVGGGGGGAGVLGGDGDGAQGRYITWGDGTTACCWY